MTDRSTQLTLVADTARPPATPVRVPDPYALRPARRPDVEALGRLYFEAYEPGVAGATLAEATDDIRASFDGDYGELWDAGSSVAALDGQPVAAVLTVWRAPWDDVPEGPFVIETFTDRSHRRVGLATALLTHVLLEAHLHGQALVGLRVDSTNTPALRLYGSLGFAVED